MLQDGSHAFSRTIIITNPGAAPETVAADLFRRGRNTDPGMDVNGTLVTDWVLLVPPTVTVLPLADVEDPDSGIRYWVHGVPEKLRSMLDYTHDHTEARLKAVYRFTTTVDIIRDSDASDRNDLGDPVDTIGALPPERTGVPATIVERSEIVPTDTDLRTLAMWVGWVASTVDVRRGDRLRRPDGALFRVESVTTPVDLGLREYRLDLARVDPA